MRPAASGMCLTSCAKAAVEGTTIASMARGTHITRLIATSGGGCIYRLLEESYRQKSSIAWLSASGHGREPA